MNIDNAFPSNYLKYSEVENDTTLTIKSIAIETLGRGQEQEEKPVIYFEETDKGLALNKTNASTIKSLYGPDTDGWIGQKITLFATEVEYAGKQVMAIRVRIRKPQAPTMGAQAGRSAALRAWDRFNETYRTSNQAGTPEDCAKEWKAFVADYFPGRNVPADIRADEWDKFVSDGFVKKASPISSKPEFTEASIPF